MGALRYGALLGLACFAAVGTYSLMGSLGLGEDAEQGASKHSLRGRALASSSASTDDADKGYLQKGPFSSLAIICFGIFYYFMVVQKYPELHMANDESREIQSLGTVAALPQASCSNCMLSWVCSQSRAAHTLDKTGVLSYVPAFIAMLFCPFCTVCYSNMATDLNERLGGEHAGACQSCMCTWCCMCCVVAQDAQSLDAATGAETGCCGVTGPDEGSFASSAEE